MDETHTNIEEPNTPLDLWQECNSITYPNELDHPNCCVGNVYNNQLPAYSKAAFYPAQFR